MLGRILAIASEWQRGRTGHPQRPHKKDKTVSELLQEGFREEQEDDLKWYHTAPTACLRSLKVLYNKWLNGLYKRYEQMRKIRRNGK